MCVCVFVQVGDRIVSINGQAVDGLSHSDVVTILKNSYGNISLQVTHTCSAVANTLAGTRTCVQLCSAPALSEAAACLIDVCVHPVADQ